MVFLSSEDYDLYKSEQKIGQLYPVLVDARGRVIDGLHRLNIDSQWRTETLEHIDSQEKFLKARIIANLHRRTVPSSEIRAWINELAEFALTQHGIEPGRISTWIAEETGYKRDTVNRYLESKYKLQEPVALRGKEGGRHLAEDSILEEVEEALGRERVQRLRAEIKEEAREELRQDPEFIIETVERAPVVLPTLKERPVTREGYYKPVLTKRQAEEMREVMEKTERDLEERRKDPEVQERARWVKAWMSLGNVLGVMDNLFCPICGSDASHLSWDCHPKVNINETHKLVKEKLEG